MKMAVHYIHQGDGSRRYEDSKKIKWSMKDSTAFCMIVYNCPLSMVAIFFFLQ